MAYDIAFEQDPDFLRARVSGIGTPAATASYYTEACCAAEAAGRRKILVDSDVRNKDLTFDDAESIAKAVAQAATDHGILAIAVNSRDPETNPDAESFAVQVFRSLAVEARYFRDDAAAAEAWIRNLHV